MPSPSDVINQDNTERRPVAVMHGMETSDGAGVNLVRVIGTPTVPQVDPFLMLDHFSSDDPDDYIAGFPEHPHRGFEAVTYLLAGHMRHRDSAGHEGVIESGGIQWMTAGRGIIHSEMPEQEQGLLSGFQLWVNLPASHKMIAPRYQELGAAAIPVEQRGDDVTLRVIAGTTEQGTQGPIRDLFTDVIYFDVTLDNDAAFSEPLPGDYNALLYAIEGKIVIGDSVAEADQLVLLGAGDRLTVRGHGPHSRFLLLAGQPLREPVARGGPFVMNTDEEIQQAFRDYRSGRF